MNEGTIAFLGKGFGFIKGVEGRTKDLFFHAKGLDAGEDFNNLSVGQTVTFDSIESGPKGDAAQGVRTV